MAADRFISINVDLEQNLFRTLSTYLVERLQEEDGSEEGLDEDCEHGVNLLLFHRRKGTSCPDADKAEFILEIDKAGDRLNQKHGFIEGIILVDCGPYAEDVSSDNSVIAEALRCLSSTLSSDMFADVLLMDYDVEEKYGQESFENINARNLNDPSVAKDLAQRVMDRYEEIERELNPDTLTFVEEEINRIVDEVMEELRKSIQDLVAGELRLAEA